MLTKIKHRDNHWCCNQKNEGTTIDNVAIEMKSRQPLMSRPRNEAGTTVYVATKNKVMKIIHVSNRKQSAQQLFKVMATIQVATNKIGCHYNLEDATRNPDAKRHWSDTAMAVARRSQVSDKSQQLLPQECQADIDATSLDMWHIRLVKTVASRYSYCHTDVRRRLMRPVMTGDTSSSSEGF